MQLPPRSNLLAGATALLRWSPDGLHRLLSSSQYGPLLVWGQLNSLSDSGIALFSEPGIAMLQY
jgi:hypothetical protein